MFISVCVGFSKLGPASRAAKGEINAASVFRPCVQENPVGFLSQIGR
jgi:hypothetical protein